MTVPSPHHPLIAGITPWEGIDPEGFFVDFLGIKTRRKFIEGLMQSVLATGERFALGLSDIVPTDALAAGSDGAEGIRPLPAFDEEYFEWLDLAESIELATDQYTFVELGAGYGRWCVRAAELVARINPVPYAFVTVEPEPTHHEWIFEHFADNGINPAEHRLIQAAVSTRQGRVRFAAGDPSAWYGQAVVEQGLRGRPLRLAKRLAKRVLGIEREATEEQGDRAIIRVPAIPIERALDGLGVVDLLDLDVQGAEADAAAGSADALSRQVRRVHIGTHSAAIEAELRALFSDMGWQCLRDFPLGAVHDTEYGPIEFEDGAQTWTNPALSPRAR